MLNGDQAFDDEYAPIIGRIRTVADLLRGQAECLDEDQAVPLQRWADRYEAHAFDMERSAPAA